MKIVAQQQAEDAHAFTQRREGEKKKHADLALHASRLRQARRLRVGRLKGYFGVRVFAWFAIQLYIIIRWAFVKFCTRGAWDFPYITWSEKDQGLFINRHWDLSFITRLVSNLYRKTWSSS